uniref:DUF19 domain-containing protein n=1 Tax=Parastrongyloides trichosuri TaxID=131310 RepID=A0A0N4ZAL6_PARTI
MNLILLFSFIFSFFLPTLTSSCDPSLYNEVRTCYNSFMNNYGFSVGVNNTLPSYETFALTRGEFEAGKTTDNMKKVCINQNLLTSCLGSAISCINSSDMSKIFYFEDEDNVSYTGDYYMADWECTTAYSVTIGQFNCLSTIGSLGSSSLDTCVDELMGNIKTEGICKAQIDYTSCLSNVYASLCGAQAGRYICNVQKIGLTYELPQCFNQLPTCQPL